MLYSFIHMNFHTPILLIFLRVLIFDLETMKESQWEFYKQFQATLSALSNETSDVKLDIIVNKYDMFSYQILA